MKKKSFSMQLVMNEPGSLEDLKKLAALAAKDGAQLAFNGVPITPETCELPPMNQNTHEQAIQALLAWGRDPARTEAELDAATRQMKREMKRWKKEDRTHKPGA